MNAETMPGRGEAGEDSSCAAAVVEPNPRDAAASDPWVPAVLREVAERVRIAFPRAPDIPELVLLDVDPWRLHAFWTLSPAAVEAAQDALPADAVPRSMVLRVSEMGPGDAAAAAFDVEVAGLQGQCYIDVPGAARRYRGAIGMRRVDGAWTALLHSAPVTLPRPGPADAEPPLPAPMSDPSQAIEAPAASGGEEAPDPAAPARVEATAPTGELPLENVLTLSSYALGGHADDLASVEFEVNAEMHIFGRARAGAKVSLFGRKVKLRPDGTFSITQPLPAGALLLSALVVDDEPTG